jgi:hypothetical protein
MGTMISGDLLGEGDDGVDCGGVDTSSVGSSGEGGGGEKGDDVS